MRTPLLFAKGVIGAVIGLATGFAFFASKAALVVSIVDWIKWRSLDALLWASIGALAAIAIAYIWKTERH